MRRNPVQLPVNNRIRPYTKKSRSIECRRVKQGILKTATKKLYYVPQRIILESPSGGDCDTEALVGKIPFRLPRLEVAYMVFAICYKPFSTDHKPLESAPIPHKVVSKNRFFRRTPPPSLHILSFIAWSCVRKHPLTRCKIGTMNPCILSQPCPVSYDHGPGPGLSHLA